MKAIKVLIIDDSALIRELLKQIFSKDKSIEVVGVAQDPYFAVDKIKKFKPDVITLDVQMPRMDGLTFLRKLMKSHPMPVVMISSLTERNCDITIRALELGAVDLITKPKKMISDSMEDLAEEIIFKVKNAVRANVKMAETVEVQKLYQIPKKYDVNAIIPEKKIRKEVTTGEKVVVMGASTGGTVAIQEILRVLPEDSPSIAIVEHIPSGFSRAFANRVNTQCKIEVKEAEDGDRLIHGRALIGPGGIHMLIQRDKLGYYIRLKDGPPVNRHIPSVDVLFRSAAYSLGKNAIGVILTGMGADGARGMLEMKEAGAYNIAQDKKTCVIYGMPEEAVNLGGVIKILPLQHIPSMLLKLGKKK